MAAVRLGCRVARPWPAHVGALQDDASVGTCRAATPIEPAVRRPEIQQERDLQRGHVPFTNGDAEVARARHVAVDLRPNTSVGLAPHRPPMAQVRSVFGQAHDE